jgi:Isochorismatase family
MSLLSRRRCTLIVVDVQEGFRSYAVFADVARSCAKLLETARILEVPALVSEQYPKGLGPSVAELGILDETRIEKTVFSAVRADGFDLAGREQAIVCGIEVHVPADAVGSRHASDYERGLARMQSAGAVVTSVEAVLFELLERAGTPEFKAVQKLII